MLWLRSGVLVDPLDLDLSLVTIEDLAWALDNVCRWGGHCCPPITVAQHTLACARAALLQSPRLALLALHHDDGEAFFGDMCRDLKSRPEMAWYREQEHLATRRCVDHFAPSCRDIDLSAIKQIDTQSLLAERESLFPRDKQDSGYHPELAPLPSWCFRRADSAVDWVAEHYRLTELL